MAAVGVDARAIDRWSGARAGIGDIGCALVGTGTHSRLPASASNALKNVVQVLRRKEIDLPIDGHQGLEYPMPTSWLQIFFGPA